MSPKLPVQNLVSAGGVVHCREGDDVHIVLCGRRSPATWSLPKGTPDEGESLEQTAMREVQEETGLEVEIEQPLGSIIYWFARPPGPVHYHKTVHFYLMSAHGGSPDLHDPEFDEVRWFTAADALKALTHVNEVDVLHRALNAIPDAGNTHG
jgi:8-oxo-dGTP pyrophosphatase MutT (NUDIX family)